MAVAANASKLTVKYRAAAANLTLAAVTSGCCTVPATHQEQPIYFS